MILEKVVELMIINANIILLHHLLFGSDVAAKAVSYLLYLYEFMYKQKWLNWRRKKLNQA